jgi:PQQ-dependent dehydrogenase (methanol/ethanol family)
MKKIARNSLVGIFAALFLCVQLAAAQTRPDIPNNPFADSDSAIDTGRAIFGGTCSACHGEGGTGGRGPALNTGSFSHGGEDNDLFQVIRGGIPGTQMPSFASFPAEDVWRVVTYLRSLPPRSAAVTGDTAAGEAVFFGRNSSGSENGCSGCHEVNGRGAKSASDLSAEGAKPAATIRDGVLHLLPTPRGAVTPHFVDVTMRDGRKLQGLVKTEDSVTVHVEQADGKYLMLDRGDIRILTERKRAAPRDVADRLSPRDIDNVVAYLAAHKGRDLTKTIALAPAPVLPYSRLANAATEPQNWSSYWGDFSGRHFSDLKQISPANVKRLQARFAAPMLGENVLESTPLVVDGVMYVTGSPGDVAAFDARSGLPIWRFHRKQDVKNPYQINPYNKGVAVLDGRVFFGTLDNNLIALDAHTGRELWEKNINNTMDGYTITGAPLALKDKVIVGMSGGEMGVRGYLDAYNPADGRLLWRFYTTPGPGVPGNETWAGDSWKLGGAPTWLTGSYDAESNTLIWATGNPAPDFNTQSRKGDNLYSDSVVALDADTGNLKWHYQFTPNDSHDWDSTEDMVLADQTIGGKPRKLLLHADRNGLFYVLDRSNGKFLWAKPFVRQTWNLGFDRGGRPIIDPGAEASPAGKGVFPRSATNFQAPSYDRKSGLFYLAYNDGPSYVASAPAVYERGKQYVGRAVGPQPPDVPAGQGIKAIDARTGKVVWDFQTKVFAPSAGLLGTGGGLLFAATAEGQLLALNAKTGKLLWSFRTGIPITASPMSYAVDGKQFVAVAAGNMIYAFALPGGN